MKAPAKCCPCGGVKINGRCERCGPTKDNRQSSAQRGYDSRWEQAKERFLRTHPVCVCCEARGVVNVERGRTGLRVDHIVPKRLAPELFWVVDNWQVICLDCDLRYKQPIEKRSRTADEVRDLWAKVLSNLRASSLP